MFYNISVTDVQKAAPEQIVQPRAWLSKEIISVFDDPLSAKVVNYVYLFYFIFGCNYRIDTYGHLLTLKLRIISTRLHEYLSQS